ncbi:hypothetical protein FHW88_005184 [Mucilaginibacter sp. SG538B]|uniref:FecR family protein n=1 Tax=Mucilaginibacter sp. SG538B TaxID=2587021 RepID=UPI00159E74FA|nr:FecR domain-containing protein [Mucilaginibacter sp. SG538B]NVM66866.1 hypothetical protein [Mucilaginibacter sp. SG538B]
MFEKWFLDTGEETELPPDDRIENLRQEILHQLPGHPAGKFSGGFLIAAAAIALIMVSLIMQLVFHKSELIIGNQSPDIPPGGNRAVLTLANGQKIDLTNAADGRLAVRPGLGVIKKASGQIQYLDDGHRNRNDGTGEDMISTPPGGTWQLRLPDGTKVWLNNSSSLRYPGTFAGQKLRTVKLEGEAYFEVAKDKAHPFVVKSTGQEVKVLGTHFNVSAFKDDQFTRTTLLEGKVAVNKEGSSQARQLVPGEQASFSKGSWTVRVVNTEQAVAWKNGYFRFDNSPLEQVMRELSRWYGVEVRYDGPLSGERMTGRISRAKNISKVLIALEATKTVHFKVEGRRVTVMK